MNEFMGALLSVEYERVVQPAAVEKGAIGLNIMMEEAPRNKIYVCIIDLLHDVLRNC